MEGKDEKSACGEEEVIALESIRFHDKSNLCPVSDPLHFTLTYTPLRDLSGAVWHIKYLFDTVTKRKIIHLGKASPETSSGETCSFTFKVERVDVSDVPKEQLANAGLLICSLVLAGEEVVDVKMVVQVSKTDESDGEYMRCIYNPLD